jgi:predicted nucleic acid-binding protein
VTRYLVDTNIISDIVKPKPSESLLTRMANQRDEDLFIASLTLAEIHQAEVAVRRPHPAVRRPGRADLGPPHGGWQRQGRPRSALDTIIVATAEAHECNVVTDNERNFDGFRVVVNRRSAE